MLPDRTTQLRRYAIPAEAFEPWLEWWQSTVVPLRARFGFEIEFAYALPTAHEFVWAISTPTDEAGFVALERRLEVSDDLVEAFACAPARPRITSSEFVTRVLPRMTA